ncbi:MAG TPA: VWA domain-containing protein [Candidatus Acidoferrales bacterium]|nr:VWA domain-containing protein [Candidatus Acidoferrales bacterium]
MSQRIPMLGIALLLSIPASAQLQGTQPPARRAPAAQQTTPAQGDTLARIRTQTNLVIVPVTVKDSEGRLVSDLQKDEFRVFSDGIEQQILLFSSDSFPLSAVILIDNDLPRKPGEQVQKSLAAISAGFGPSDEAALVTYDQYPTTVSDFSFNNDELFTHLKRLELGTHSDQVNSGPTGSGPIINGNTMPTSAPPTGQGISLHGSGRYQNDAALDDALYAAGDMLKARGRDRRKIIFLISDGSDSRQNHHTFQETLQALLADDVSVYSISVTRSIPVPIGKSLVEHGASELQKYADGTGGDTFHAAKQSDLERLYSDVTEEARNQYTLTFQPNAADHSRDYHTIEVRVRRPNLNVLARQGYYQSSMTVGH